MKQDTYETELELVELLKELHHTWRDLGLGVSRPLGPHTGLPG